MGRPNFQEKKKFERVIYSVPVVIILGILVVMAFWGIAKTWIIHHNLANTLENSQKKYVETSSQRASLEERFEELETQEGLFRETRERFNLKKPGEELVVFLDAESEFGVENEGSFWERPFFNYLKIIWPF